jgi:hypothetical protein
MRNQTACSPSPGQDDVHTIRKKRITPFAPRLSDVRFLPRQGGPFCSAPSFLMVPLSRIPPACFTGGPPGSMLTRVSVRVIARRLNHQVSILAPVSPGLDQRGGVEPPFRLQPARARVRLSTCGVNHRGRGTHLSVGKLHAKEHRLRNIIAPVRRCSVSCRAWPRAASYAALVSWAFVDGGTRTASPDPGASVKGDTTPAYNSVDCFRARAQPRRGIRLHHQEIIQALVSAPCRWSTASGRFQHRLIS